jgi:ZipA, C-terminal FtsZ-binding domain
MISDFQIILIGIVAVIVVAVIVYNRWQEAKYKRRAENAFAGERGDALFDQAPDRAEARVEPTLSALPASGVSMRHVGANDDLDDLDLNVPGVTDVERIAAPARSAAADLAPTINGEVDTIALILADQPVDADTYAPMIRESQTVAKNILWEGLVGGLWVPIDPTADEKYRELRAGLQLADRGGAVDPAEIANFDEMMRGFAAGIDAVSQRENTQEAARRSQMVDQFCAETDVEIAVNLVGKLGVTFAATKIRGLAEAQGLTALASGEFAMMDDINRVLFVLRNGHPDEPLGIRRDQGYHTQLTFAIDVPRTPNAAENFQRMFTLALQFADVLQADVVDDNKKLLTANGRKMIHDTIREILGEMQQKGIASGSSTALRLYA